MNIDGPTTPGERDSLAVVISLDILKRLVGAAAGIAPDREAVEAARAAIAKAEELTARKRDLEGPN